MKKYRLKQWYPNLHLAWSTTDNYEYDREDNRMYNRTRWGTIPITAPYLHPDFWELIEDEEPLLITDDDIGVLNKEALIYIVNKNFYKKKTELCNIYDKLNREDFKYFLHESNADEYIWRNKRLFSYNDIEKYQSGGDGVWYDVKAIAIGRSEE